MNWQVTYIGWKKELLYHVLRMGQMELQIKDRINISIYSLHFSRRTHPLKSVCQNLSLFTKTTTAVLPIQCTKFVSIPEKV